MAGRQRISDQQIGQLRQPIIWGGTLGLSMALLLPQSGVLALLGHLGHTAVWPVFGATIKGLLIGAATGGAVGWLRVAPGVFSLPYSTEDPAEVGQQRACRAPLAEQLAPSELNELVQRFGYEHQVFLSLL